jgi:hypothetical protein
MRNVKVTYRGPVSCVLLIAFGINRLAGNIDWPAFASMCSVSRAGTSLYNMDSLGWNASVLVGPVLGVLVAKVWLMSQSE